jgi:hypothetical protein
MDESNLRKLAIEYLNNKFSKYNVIVPFFDLHEEGITLSTYLRKKFFGKELSKLPYYKEVEIRPDVVGIIDLPETTIWAYVLGEAKTTKVNMADFRQCMNYMNIGHPYEGYLFYCERLTNEVMKNILADNHKYQGLNIWGKNVTKRVGLLAFKRNRFTNGRLDL